jgi:phage-related protein (TIGR01555 family)
MREDASTASSQMGSVYNEMSGMGGLNDKGTAGRPNVYRGSLLLGELDALYRFNGYAQRIVDQHPKDGTRKGWALDDDTEVPNPLAQELKDLGAKEALKQGATWGRLYGAGAVWIVTEEKTGTALSEPLTLENIKRVVNLVPLDAYEFRPSEIETDPDSKNYRKPRLYQLTPHGVTVKDGGIVHHSRIMYFPGVVLPNALRPFTQTGMDESVLDGAWDAVRNLTSVDQGTGTMAQDSRTRVLKTPSLEGRQASDTGESFRKRLQLLASSLSLLNMAVIGSNEDLRTDAPSLSGWGELGPQARLALAAQTGIPQTLLYGETPGGLSTDGESWRKMWAASVADWQESKLRGPLEWLIALLYATRDAPPPTTWTLSFNPLDELTEPEVAALKKTNAERDAIYIDRGVYTPEDVATARFGGAGYNEITGVKFAETDEEEMDRMRRELEEEEEEGEE